MAALPVALTRQFRLYKWMLRQPVVYVLKTPDGYYVGETTDLKHRYHVAELESLVYVKRACRNRVARMRQEQALLAEIMQLGLPYTNEKIETHDPVPWTLCDVPDKPASQHKRTVPDPDPDSDPD